MKKLKKEKLYKAVVKPKYGAVYVINFIPEFGLKIKEKLLKEDSNVERFFIEEM